MNAPLRLHCIGTTIALGKADLTICEGNILISHKKTEKTIPLTSVKEVVLDEPRMLMKGTLTISTGKGVTGFIPVAGILAGVGQEEKFIFADEELYNARAIKQFIVDFLKGNTLPPSQSSIADEITKYKNLLDNGAITEDEYAALKSRLIG